MFYQSLKLKNLYAEKLENNATFWQKYDKIITHWLCMYVSGMEALVHADTLCTQVGHWEFHIIWKLKWMNEAWNVWSKIKKYFPSLIYRGNYKSVNTVAQCRYQNIALFVWASWPSQHSNTDSTNGVGFGAGLSVCLASDRQGEGLGKKHLIHVCRYILWD